MISIVIVCIGLIIFAIAMLIQSRKQDDKIKALEKDLVESSVALAEMAAALTDGTSNPELKKSASELEDKLMTFVVRRCKEEAK